MESRRELERAFQFLRYLDKTLESRPIETSTIGELAFFVGWAYVKNVARKRFLAIEELTIPGAPGEVIQRKCSSCGSEVIDDAFPRFAKKKRTAYVVRTREREGCGQPGCKGKSLLIPTDEWQTHIRGSRKLLENPPKVKGRADFSTFLCRSEKELDGLPKTVQTICEACGCPKLYGYARWTIEKEPRFVIPRLNCKACDKDRYFRPVETCETIFSSQMSKFWTNVMGDGFDLTVNPAIRKSLFEQGDFTMMKGILMRLQKRTQDCQ